VKAGERLVVLASERRGEMVGVTRDGRILVQLDGDPQPVVVAAHPIEETWIAEAPWH
jgi:hypothetical protein